MKFTLIRTDKTGSLRLSTVEAGKFFDRVKNQRKKPQHEVFPGAEMRTGGNGQPVMVRNNGIVVLTVAPLATTTDVEDVKSAVMTLPATMAAITGSDGHSVVVLARYQLKDDKPATDEQVADTLAQAAYEMAMATCSRVTGRTIQRQQASARMHFAMASDPQALFNTEATPFCLEQYGKETMRLIDFLTARYELRFNSIMGYTEYRLRMQEDAWQPAEESVINGMTMAARLSGVDAWDKDVRRYLQSNMIQVYNPLTDFLGRARQAWDGHTDHIGRLAATVPCQTAQWSVWFRKWLLYMVAQWMGVTRRYGNSVVPLFISQQGCNKSTFCRSLLPDELAWGYNDNLLVSEKKATLQAMAQMLLINLDEFNQIPARLQDGFLKNVVQLARVKIKRPYGRHVEDMTRLASFVATTNEYSVLADTSGSRRFIGIELTGSIDVSKPIDHLGLYGQAVALVEQGEQYWFDSAEVAEIMEHNRQYQVQTVDVQWFNEIFEPATGEDDGEWLTSAAIFSCVRKKVGASFRGNLVNFGRTLSHVEGLHKKHSRRGQLYLVRQRS
ncbi:MAG: DUF3874 domain-containing protein [Prevotella sp.]|nr:DUF3874 domain-containing protein [Prevotella sp.]